MRLSIIAALIGLSLVALFAACGGDDKATSAPSTAPTSSASNESHTATSKATGSRTTGNGGNQDYFTQLQAYFDDSRTRTDDATSKLDSDLAAATTLDGDKKAINTFLDTMIAVFDDAITTMDNLDPPTQAKTPHNTFRDDISHAKDISQGLQNDISDATTQAEAQAVIDDFNTIVAGLVNHAQAACRDLQTIADDQNAGVDLQCKSG